jgi:transketolase
MIGELLDVRKTFADKLLKIGSEDDRLVVLEADLMKCSGSRPFMEKYPERHYQFGIAEQNMIGVAAGLALMGKIPFASTFANFASQRACDQAVISIAYNRLNVKICGDYAGLTSAKNGATHISVEDTAIFRSMPYMTVIDPADCVELSQALEAIYSYDGPVYLRKSRGPMPTIFGEEHSFEIGKAITLTAGGDATLITSGITTHEGCEAVKVLHSRGIEVNHLHMGTIKPLDVEAVVEAARKTGLIFTVENHSCYGGLGSAVAETVCEHHPVPVIRLGFQDRFGDTATLEWLIEEYGISSARIVLAIESYFNRT